MWQIELSRQADKFAKKENIKDDEILNLVKKVINYSKGLDENIDVKKMKDKWKGYYRIKIGKVRMILSVLSSVGSETEVESLRPLQTTDYFILICLDPDG